MACERPPRNEQPSGFLAKAEDVAEGPVERRVGVWVPVGTGVQPGADTRVLAVYLLTGGDERVAARKVDDFIRRLPGFENVRLLEAWGRRAAAPELRRGRLLASRPLSRS